MARIEEGGEERPPPPLPSTSDDSILKRRPDPFLVVCKCFSVLTCLTALLCTAVNVLSAIRSFKNGSDIFDGIFRCYAVLIALFLVLAETEWGAVLEYWAGRGSKIVAVMTRAFPDSTDPTEIVLLKNIASYMLLACGLVYLISGILCIGCLKRSREQKEITRDQAIKDLEVSHHVTIVSEVMGCMQRSNEAFFLHVTSGFVFVYCFFGFV
ncbi:hypothetical protein JRO89_XS02G0143600 [Xanthoceras sorbifolium]|uniref:Uncharacterized protein n=1 Tax=Xanthoceras sorbifolium TaxID=99658 RepID=A0ABQ8IFX0_9ROSI|nr:hypothetical protein JRO89_XS02G0143600 [Xanthoceras sorbifolium]